MLALISAVQAVVLALIASGQISLGRHAADPADDNLASNNAAASAPAAPEGIDVGLVNLAATGLDSDICVHQAEVALQNQQFSEPNTGSDSVFMTRDGLGAFVWCQGGAEPIVIAVAGPDGTARAQVVALLQRNLTAALPNYVAH